MDARDRAGGDLFEGLWLLRACYPYRSDYDAQPMLSVNEAIEFGEELLRAAHFTNDGAASDCVIAPPDASRGPFGPFQFGKVNSTLAG